MLPSSSTAAARPPVSVSLLAATARPGAKAEQPEFQAVILCGYGESLYPLTEGRGAMPKALLPLGEGVLVDRVLEWVDESGIVDVLLLCPKAHYAAVTAHLRTAWAPAHHSVAHPKGTRIRIQVHTLDERAEREVEGPASAGEPSGMLAGGRGVMIPTSASSLPNGAGHRAQHSLSLPDMGQSPQSAMIGSVEGRDEDEGMGGVEIGGLGSVVGTGRLLRRWRDWIKSDFILLPCDIVPPPSLPLSTLLDRHRSRPSSLLTTLWYERTEVEARDKDSPEAVLLGHDRQSGEVLFVQPLEELEDEMSIRMGLLRSHHTLSMTTTLLDAHVYVFRRAVLDLMMTREPKDLESVREDLVPWLVKGGWQEGLREKWSSILNAKPDPLAAALAKSTTNPYSTTVAPPEPHHPSSVSASALPTQPSSPSRPSEGQALLEFKNGLQSHGHGRRRRRENDVLRTGADELRCNLVIWKAPKEPEVEVKGQQGKGGKGQQQQQQAQKEAKVEKVLLRGNTVGGYWELNRQFLRVMPPNLANLPQARQPQTPTSAAPATPASASSSQPAPVVPNIDPRAQISPDSLVAPSTRIGERSNVKKSIIGRHCVIGKNVRIQGCVIWDFVNIADGAKLDNAILCNNVRIGEKAQIKDCELGAGYEAGADANLKSERLTAGQDAA